MVNQKSLVMTNEGFLLIINQFLQWMLRCKPRLLGNYNGKIKTNVKLRGVMIEGNPEKTKM